MLIEGQARSVLDLIPEAERIRKQFKKDDDDREEIWYRGQPSSEFTLFPTLYRPEVDEFHYDELSLMDRFEALSTPLLPRQPSSPMEWYFLAQHHGLPSRLLDWTEDVLTAAYFAIEQHLPLTRLELDALCRGERPAASCKVEEWPVVWVLDAGTLNRHSMDTDGVAAMTHMAATTTSKAHFHGVANAIRACSASNNGYQPAAQTMWNAAKTDAQSAAA